jgi:two-component system, OmpR family, response regulator
LGRARSASSGVKAAKIVIVDDDVDLAEELREALADAGYLVETMSDSMTASGLIRGAGPDVILLDIMMSGKDGFEVARELAKDPETAGIPIVMMTGTYTCERRGLARDIPGVKDILIKPFSCEDMVARIESARLGH